MFKKDKTKEAGGSPIYMAPETLIYNHFSFSSDIWALGCILYELCTLQAAFGFVQVNFKNKTFVSNLNRIFIIKMFPIAVNGRINTMHINQRIYSV